MLLMDAAMRGGSLLNQQECICPRRFFFVIMMCAINDDGDDDDGGLAVDQSSPESRPSMISGLTTHEPRTRDAAQFPETLSRPAAFIS